jgi:hypothetical protein
MSPILDPLAKEVARAVQVEQSAEKLINGIQGIVDAGVVKAMADGATAAQLAPFTDLSAALAAEDTALAEAVAANTPAATAKPKGAKP